MILDGSSMYGAKIALSKTPNETLKSFFYK